MLSAWHMLRRFQTILRSLQKQDAKLTKRQVRSVRISRTQRKKRKTALRKISNTYFQNTKNAQKPDVFSKGL